MEEVLSFLKSCGVYYLATVDQDKPKVRPFGTAEIFEGHLYIQTGKKKDVYKQIEKILMLNYVHLMMVNGLEYLEN